MILSKILLGIIHVQLLSPALGNKTPTLEITETEIEFGADLEVIFKLKDTKPSLGDFVGIYKKGEYDVDDYEAYLYTCDSKDYESSCLYLDPPKEGTLTFSVRDPDCGSGARQDWPLNPGRYQACLFNYDEGKETSTLLSKKCEQFKIKGIEKKALKKVTVLMDGMLKFDVGAPITFNFKSKQATIPGQWFTIYPAEGFNSTGGLSRIKDKVDHWIYAGCNNQFGDQKTELCSKTVSEGTVVMNQVSQKFWAIPAGKYKVCLIFSTNTNEEDKYTWFKCHKKAIRIVK